MTPVHQLMPTLLFLINKPDVFNFKLLLPAKMYVHYITFSSEKSHLVWIRKEISIHSALFASDNHPNTVLNHSVGRFWCERTTVDWICHYIICFFSSLDSYLWRHPFTAEDPLVKCNAKYLQISSNEETNSSIFWMAWEWVNFLLIFIFGWTIPLHLKPFK